MPSEEVIKILIQGGAVGVLILFAVIGLILAQKWNPNAGTESDKKDDDVKLALAGLADRAQATADKAINSNKETMERFIERQTEAMESNTVATNKLIEAQIVSAGDAKDIKEMLTEIHTTGSPPLQRLITRTETMEGTLNEMKAAQDMQLEQNTTLYNLAVQALSEAREVMQRIQEKRKTGEMGKTKEIPAVNVEPPKENL